MAKLHFHGHATFTLVTDDGTTIVIDPFFDENPSADMKQVEVEGADFVFVTHGHGDHFADAIPLARRTGAMLVSTFEIVQYAGSQGLDELHPMGVGGGWTFPFGRVKTTIAHHSGMIGPGLPDAEGFPSSPVGFLFDLGPGKRVYFAGDTALTLDMQLLKGKVDVAVLPIGDNFTMGPEDAARAVEFIEPSVVIPIHYGTWPYIEVDVETFVDAVGDGAEVVVLGEGRRDWEF